MPYLVRQAHLRIAPTRHSALPPIVLFWVDVVGNAARTRAAPKRSPKTPPDSNGQNDNALHRRYLLFVPAAFAASLQRSSAETVAHRRVAPGRSLRPPPSPKSRRLAAAQIADAPNPAPVRL